MDTNRVQKIAFVIGDYMAGATVGAGTAAAVHKAVDHSTDMVLAMLVGMALGMVVHLAIGLLLTPVLGAFHTMIPGSLIGMYGGMLFAMRDTMQHTISLARSVEIGAIFGVVVVALIQMYDRALRAGQNPGRMANGSRVSSQMGTDQPDIQPNDLG